ERAAHEMQVGAADRACRDADQRVGRLFELRVPHRFEADVTHSMEDDGFHRLAPPGKAGAPQAACRVSSSPKMQRRAFLLLTPALLLARPAIAAPPPTVGP